MEISSVFQSVRAKLLTYWLIIRLQRKYFSKWPLRSEVEKTVLQEPVTACVLSVTERAVMINVWLFIKESEQKKRADYI